MLNPDMNTCAKCCHEHNYGMYLREMGDKGERQFLTTPDGIEDAVVPYGSTNRRSRARLSTLWRRGLIYRYCVVAHWEFGNSPVPAACPYLMQHLKAQADGG